MEAQRIERLRRRATAHPLVLLLRLAVPFALLALYAASVGSRPRALRVEVASARPGPTATTSTAPAPAPAP
ncbi:hypothetical protein [Anaeromyxobacter oryzae]|uniref:Uncharacterized protein n=1 Tax=Anaeromyxobacter oryzae TaxID=2918170 RepID=A0ABM7WQR2_9BACT|nr:hypothetical protein [Anaeromyxobacter oryzae]BDG01803.1 hypothetical protein AMOR_07990 [Anaeromyxobacter oryzae]